MGTTEQGTTEQRRPLIELDPAGVDQLRDRLLAHAFLFDDPRVYRAGVEDALAELRAQIDNARATGGTDAR